MARAFGLCLGLAGALGAWPAAARAQSDAEAPRSVDAEQSRPVAPVISDVDVRTLPAPRAWRAGDPVREVPRRQYPRGPAPRQGGQGAVDPLLELDEEAPAGASRAFDAPNLNFNGISFSGAVPPDPVGDVGPNHYVQMTNSGGGSTVVIYSKTGAIVAGPFNLDSLWSGGGACRFGAGDPIVLYDGLADRWLLSEFAAVGNRLCVYVSQTSDPVAGGWFGYDFQVPQFPDYPKYAVWPDAYYVSSNESVPAAYALDRTRMLSGLAASFQRFTATNLAGFPFQALIPSDLDGPPPPTGAPNYFMRHRDDEAHNPGNADPTRDFLEIWEFSVDFGNPANSTFGLAAIIAVSEFDSNLCGLSSFQCFPQPSTATRLDPLREVIMWRLQYRNFGTHETLVGNLVSDVDGTDHGGIRWFELRKTGLGGWSLFQEGTYAPDAEHRWMGSVAMDASGNIALGYSVSSTATFPSIRYAGRLAGDPAGTLPQGENSIIEGGFSQTNTTRWGDYSAMSVDPADGCTFWYTAEYVANGSSQWGTRIASFRFAECDQVPPLGGATTGLINVFAGCVNIDLGQFRSAGISLGQVAWDCEAAGLPFASGDRVAVIVVGGARAGADPVGGEMTAAQPLFAQCTNHSRGQQVGIPIPAGETTWDCEAAGLAVTTGDVVLMIAIGDAD